MANYRQVATHFPAVRTYLRHRKWVRRADVVAYAPNVTTPCFSTDALGFRHSTFEGRGYSLADVGTLDRYGLVLGSSHVFGFGLSSNGDTVASQLAQQVGYPCLTICYPEADTRSLHATLLRVLAGNHRPELVVLFNGGDFTRFCYTGRCDPLFGCPDFEHPSGLEDETAIAREVQHLCFFTRFWSEQIVLSAQQAGARVLLADEPTFFEKTRLDAIETACELGAGANTARFERHRQHVVAFHDARVSVLEQRLGGRSWPACYNDYFFIDEFHYRAESIAKIVQLLLV